MPPADPSEMSSAVVPADWLGTLMSSIRPDDVRSEIEMAISRIPPYWLDSWPTAPVATQPPTVEYLKDSGKLPQVYPAFQSAASRSEPVTPAPARTKFFPMLTEEKFFMSTETVSWPAPGISDPFTELPPPYGITFRPLSRSILTEDSSDPASGYSTPPTICPKIPCLAASISGEDLPME